MTEITVHDGRVRYELTTPWFIGAGLHPTVKVGDTSTVELWVHEWPDNEGRVRYGYDVREDGATIATGTDLRSGCWDEPDLDAMLSTLISFAQYYAEHTDFVDRGGFDDGPLSDEDKALGEWASAHEDDLWEFIDMGEDN